MQVPPPPPKKKKNKNKNKQNTQQHLFYPLNSDHQDLEGPNIMTQTGPPSHLEVVLVLCARQDREAPGAKKHLFRAFRITGFLLRDVSCKLP